MSAAAETRLDNEAFTGPPAACCCPHSNQHSQLSSRSETVFGPLLHSLPSWLAGWLARWVSSNAVGRVAASIHPTGCQAGWAAGCNAPESALLASEPEARARAGRCPLMDALTLKSRLVPFNCSTGVQGERSSSPAHLVRLRWPRSVSAVDWDCTGSRRVFNANICSHFPLAVGQVFGEEWGPTSQRSPV